MFTGLLIALPLFVSLLIFLLRPPYARQMAVVGSVLQFLLGLFVITQLKHTHEAQHVINLPWIPSMGIHFYAGIDGISAILVLLTNLLVPFILLVNGRDKASETAGFFGLVMLMQAALVGVFTARDGFLFYIFWEMALIPIYFICLMWGGKERMRITLKFFIYTMSGSLLMLLAFIIIYLHTPLPHQFSFEAMLTASKNMDAGLQGILFWLIFLAFAIKIPVFPFHTWQPDTYTDAPVQGTMLLSGIMLKMGTYGLMRWLLPVLPLGVSTWGYTAIVLSVIGIIYGAVIAIMQEDYKRLAAYSSFSHAGLIAAGILSLQTSALQGALVQMLSHGMLVVALFYLIELIEQRSHTRNIGELGGIRTQSPIFSAVFMLVLLGSVALPLTSGFVGEFLLIGGLYAYHPYLAALAGVTIILGAVYMLRSFRRALLGEPQKATIGFAEISSNEKLILYPLLLLVFLIGIYPKPLLDLSEPSVKHLLQTIQSPHLTLR